ncbi:uncharacterized protein [Atheta coriaria]|uniref:uncharacterized protein n=1 Tax=Dalotia coriaria TaxID=877792 RepID=UPI0031F41A78
MTMAASLTRNRPNDYFYDSSNISSGPKDFYKQAKSSKQAMMSYAICPIFPSMFSDLQNYPCKQYVIRRAAPIPAYVEKVPKSAEKMSRAFVAGSDRYKYFHNSPISITQVTKETVPQLDLNCFYDIDRIRKYEDQKRLMRKKTWKHISNLSGGEKTLSSLALVFALHYYKPSPLYVLDEIDAALDFKNVSIIANYIKERTKNAQFIIISLRNEMFELSCHLIGIYKPDNTTMTVTIDPRKFDGEKQVEQVRGQQKDAEVDLSLEPTEMESLSSIGSVLTTTNGTLMVTQNTQDQNGRKSVPAEENGLPASQEDIFASQQTRTSEISDIIPPSQEPETNMEVD